MNFIRNNFKVLGHIFVIHTILWFILFISGCRESPLLFRAGADYFPLAAGNTWIYSHIEVDTSVIILKVIQTESIEGRDSCWLLERNVSPEYWWKDEQGLDKLYLRTKFISGDEITLANFWMPWLKLPLVLNNSWNVTFEQSVKVLGDVIKTKAKVSGKVIALEDDIYKVQIELIEKDSSTNFGFWCDTTVYYEWYEPNVGITKRLYDNVEEYLVDYTL